MKQKQWRNGEKNVTRVGMVLRNSLNNSLTENGRTKWSYHIDESDRDKYKRDHGDVIITWTHFPNYFPLWGEPTGHRLIPLKKMPVMRGFDIFFDVSPGNHNQTVHLLFIWDNMMPMWHHCNAH